MLKNGCTWLVIHCTPSMLVKHDICISSNSLFLLFEYKVTGAHQIVDDQDGLTTQIGKEEINFPQGTILFTGMTIANLDEERFENPYVFDPENRDFSKLTSFNAVGEKSYKPSPRICPGRNVAIMTVAKMIKAKYAA